MRRVQRQAAQLVRSVEAGDLSIERFSRVDRVPINNCKVSMRCTEYLVLEKFIEYDRINGTPMTDETNIASWNRRRFPVTATGCVMPIYSKNEGINCLKI